MYVRYVCRNGYKARQYKTGVFTHPRKNSKAGAHYKGNSDKEKKPEGKGKNCIDSPGKTLWICINLDLGI